MSVKCSNCGHAMKKFSGVNRIFKDRYIVSDATVYVYKKCGEEHITAQEYERIRKKIAAVESKAGIPSVQAVMAKARFLVL